MARNTGCAGHDLGDVTEEKQLPVPTSLKERPRTYLITGSMGVIFFVASGMLWDEHQFAGSLLLELGGGAFIAFLLEFVLPVALNATDGGVKLFWGTELEWSSSSLRALLGNYEEDQARTLLANVERGSYPDRPSARIGVYDTGAQIDGARLFKKQVAAESILTYYVTRQGKRRRKRVVVHTLQLIT